ncbi:hypothetical protein EAE99_010793 [Botrytis elliptica]|nr:hypothetical protein EAE99_010793 [Botrytis elliptica]
MSLTPEQIAYMQEHASDDQRTGIIAFGVICSIAAIVAVGSRFVARPTSKSKVGLDDWFITVGLIITISYVISYCPTTKYGMSRHVIFVTDLHGFAARSFKITLWIVRVFVVAYSYGRFIADVFQCTPINHLWNQQPGGHCIRYGEMVLASGIIRILTDVTMLCMPMPLLWGLKLERNRKVLIYGIFLREGL